MTNGTFRPLALAMAIASALATACALVCVDAAPARAQHRVGNRVGADSATRLTRLGRDLAYGSAEGLAFAGVDQLSDSPPEWGHGWPGYERRAASNVGEFVIQESVTEGLAAVMHRPLDYMRSPKHDTGDRIAWALHGAFTDEMPDGTHPLATPRIVGAFVGSFAQASWRPGNHADRTRVALVNGATSLVIGAGINLFHEFIR